MLTSPLTTSLNGAGCDPLGIAQDSSFNYYIGCANTGQVYKVNAASGGSTVPYITTQIAPSAYGVTIALPSNIMYVTSYSVGYVYAISTTGVQTQFTTSSVSEPCGLVWDATQTYLYVNARGLNSVARVTASGTVTASWATSVSDSIGVAFDQTQQLWATGCGSNTIYKINTASSTAGSPWYTSSAINCPLG